MSMSIEDIIKSDMNVIFTLSKSDLMLVATLAAQQSIGLMKSMVSQEMSESHYSPKETAKLLGVSERTLQRWKNPKSRNFLMPITIAGNTRYRKADVDEVMGRLNKKQ